MKIPRLPALLSVAAGPLLLLPLRFQEPAQESVPVAEALAGSWEGSLQAGPRRHRTVFRLEADGRGNFTGTVDDLDQKVYGLPVSAVKLGAERAVTLEVAMTGGVFAARLSEDGRALAGTWKQRGMEIPLEMTRTKGFPPLPAALRDRLAGVWEGALRVGAVELRLVFHLQAGGNGLLGGSMDSPDQGAKDIALTRADFLGEGRVRICIGSVGGAFEASLEEGGDSLAGTFRQGGQELPLALHRVAAPTRVNRPQTPKPPFPYRQEEVSYENKAGGVTLAGTLTLPPGDGPFPAALLITGSGAQDRDETIFQHHPFLVIADHLTRAGVAVLRVDDRGVGGTSPGPKGATTADFAGDVRAGIAFLRGLKGIDPARIGLIGHSEGGIIAPMVASQDKDLAFVVLLAGTGLPGSKILEMQSALIARASGAEEQEIATNRNTQTELFAIVQDESLSPEEARAKMKQVFRANPDIPAGQEGEKIIGKELAMLESPWLRYFIRLDPALYLEKVKCPVLAMNGTLDLQVPCKEDLEAIGMALEKGGNPDYTLKKLPGLNHLFQHAKTGLVTEYGHIEETFSPEALDLMTAWILERVGNRKS